MRIKTERMYVCGTCEEFDIRQSDIYQFPLNYTPAGARHRRVYYLDTGAYDLRNETYSYYVLDDTLGVYREERAMEIASNEASAGPTTTTDSTTADPATGTTTDFETDAVAVPASDSGVIAVEACDSKDEIDFKGVPSQPLQSLPLPPSPPLSPIVYRAVKKDARIENADSASTDPDMARLAKLVERMKRSSDTQVIDLSAVKTTDRGSFSSSNGPSGDAYGRIRMMDRIKRESEAMLEQAKEIRDSIPKMLSEDDVRRIAREEFELLRSASKSESEEILKKVEDVMQCVTSELDRLKVSNEPNESTVSSTTATATATATDSTTSALPDEAKITPDSANAATAKCFEHIYACTQCGEWSRRYINRGHEDELLRKYGDLFEGCLHVGANDRLIGAREISPYAYWTTMSRLEARRFDHYSLVAKPSIKVETNTDRENHAVLETRKCRVCGGWSYHWCNRDGVFVAKRCCDRYGSNGRLIGARYFKGMGHALTKDVSYLCEMPRRGLVDSMPAESESDTSTGSDSGMDAAPETKETKMETEAPPGATPAEQVRYLERVFVCSKSGCNKRVHGFTVDNGPYKSTTKYSYVCRKCEHDGCNPSKGKMVGARMHSMESLTKRIQELEDETYDELQRELCGSATASSTPVETKMESAPINSDDTTYLEEVVVCNERGCNEWFHVLYKQPRGARRVYWFMTRPCNHTGHNPAECKVIGARVIKSETAFYDRVVQLQSASDDGMLDSVTKPHLAVLKAHRKRTCGDAKPYFIESTYRCTPMCSGHFRYSRVYANGVSDLWGGFDMCDNKKMFTVSGKYFVGARKLSIDEHSTRTQFISAGLVVTRPDLLTDDERKTVCETKVDPPVECPDEPPRDWLKTVRDMHKQAGVRSYTEMVHKGGVPTFASPSLSEPRSGVAKVRRGIDSTGPKRPYVTGPTRFTSIKRQSLPGAKRPVASMHVSINSTTGPVDAKAGWHHVALGQQ